MRRFHFFALAAFSLIALVAAGDGRQKGKGGGKGGPGGGATVEPAEVPEYVFNTFLGRPGADSITVSVLAWKDLDAFIAYGERADALSQRTESFKLTSATPRHVEITKLKPNTRYFYQLNHRATGSPPGKDEVRSFHTQRATGSAFTFVIQADSHLDTNTDVRVYQQTLKNMLADNPDFLVDLGDTTMVDKFGKFYTRAESQYRAQRYYLGQVAHSLPVFLTLGNHDGEKGERLDGKDSMPVWSVGMRKKFFPNPEPGGIYSGNSTPFESAGLLQDYFAWQWGDALFIVLDPFWFTTKRGGDDNWSMTIGDEQYRWLTSTLEKSKAAFKFVFIHHLVGGLVRDVRGGAAVAPYMEWGGKNADGSDGFAQHRKGWPLPIHELLKKHGVNIVFHGHDHLFVKEEYDGIIYQEVPQPGHPSGGTRSAEEYGYRGTILGSSGHLRVAVSPAETTADYVRSIVPGVTRDTMANASVEYHYAVRSLSH